MKLLMFAKPEDKGGTVLQVGVGAIKIEFYCFKVLDLSTCTWSEMIHEVNGGGKSNKNGNNASHNCCIGNDYF